MASVDWGSLYRDVCDYGARKRLIEPFAYSASAWLKWFKKYSEDRDTSSVRAMRVHIIEGTLKACKQLRYPHGPEQRAVQICKDVSVMASQAQRTILYDLTTRYDLSPSTTDYDDYQYDEPMIDQPTPATPAPDNGDIVTVIEVKNADCLDEALRLKQLGLNPVVLNMASAKRPGGGYENGAGAQEENLFRRTNLALVLADVSGLDPKRNWYYPLPEFSSVYTPSAFVLRSSEQTGYDWLPEPVEMAFVAVAAYSHPATNTKRDGSIWLTRKMAEKTERKIRGLLWTALTNGHDSIVLSALGCGAYRNPPKHIAQLFKRALSDPMFKNKFRHIVFAIFDDHNAHKAHNPEGNVKPFADIFGV